MAAGIRSQQIAAPRVALAPTAFAGLLGVALLVGGLLGVATKSEFDSITGTQVTAQAASSNLVSRMLTERAHIAVGRGPLVGDPRTGGSRPQVAIHATEHIGLSERLFPLATVHRLEHGPLR